MPMPTILDAARNALGERHSSGWIVGGSVRDALIGRESTDIDLAVDVTDVGALAQAIAKSTGSTAVTLDSKRDIHRLVAKPDLVRIDLCPVPEGIGPDLLRRDFTVNALALPLQLWPNVAISQVIDPCGGLKDLHEKLLRAVSEAGLQQDPLRMLRAVRFSAELGFQLDTQTSTWIRSNAALIPSVAGERIRDDLVRIMRLPGISHHLRDLDGLGLLTRLIPELEEARGVAQPKEHHWDVLEHSIEAVGKVQAVLRVEPLVPSVASEICWTKDFSDHFDQRVSGDRTRSDVLRFAALLHDVAKPACKTVGHDGSIRFHGHPKAGMAPTRRVLNRLRFSTREASMAEVMVREHLRPGFIIRGSQHPTRRTLYRYFRDTGEAAVDTLFLSLADYLAARGSRLEQDDWHTYSNGIHGILEACRLKSNEVPVPKIFDGHDLMGTLGLKPGPVLGYLMGGLREAQAAGDIETRSEAIALASQLLAAAHVPGARKAPTEG